jgi:hypothetical protein
VKLDRAIDDVREREAQLAELLRTVGERHATEPDLYHLGHSLARSCVEHVTRLLPFAQRYGAATDGAMTDGAAPDGGPGMLEALRRKGSQLLRHDEPAGLLLLRDLRELYLAAQDSELAWVVLLQAAKAARDADLVEVAEACHEEADGCGRWLRTRLKEAAPQVLATG